MKKRLVVLVIIVLMIIIGFVVKNKINNSKIEYELEEVSIYNYLKYKENDKFGIIDRKGQIIIEANYSRIEVPNPEKDIFLCYDDGEKCTVINSKKETLFEKYDNIESIKLKNIASTLCYEKSVLKYEKDGLYGLIDFNGKEITKNIYTSIENLQSTEGKFLVCKDEKYGVINLNGVTLVDTKYDKVKTDDYYTDETGYIEAGFIVSNTTEEGYRYGYINYQGKKLLDVEYNDLIRITEQKDVYLIAAKNGQYGLYKENKELIKPEYQSILYTDNGAIIIERNKNFGIANLKGEIKVQIKYTEIEENGIYLYAQNSKENDVYDIDGNKIDINFNKSVYETGNENYRITTILNNDITYYGIENKEGTVLVDSNYSYIEYIYGDYFIAENQKEKFGVINSNGKVIIKFKYDLIQQIKNKNVIQVSSTESKAPEIYSSNLELIVSMKSAKVQNGKNYIKVYNSKEELYLDKDGNKIEEDSDLIQKELDSQLPEEVNELKKVQYSLDDAYYTK